MDNLDLDLVVKVFSHTVLSPFFAFWVPIIYKAQGIPWSAPIVVSSSIYFLAVSAFWLLKFASRLWRNGGSLLFSPERLDWGEQVVVITGGSGGLGALLANTLAVRNVAVAVLDVVPIETENYNISFYKCDVSKWEEVEAAAKKIREDLGDPTIIVNNAGVVQGKLITDLTSADVEQTFGVNVLSHFHTLRAFLPEMIKQKAGHVVTVSSIMGLAAASQMIDYCASKAALVALHESLRYELDKKHNAPNIRTTLLLPGLLQTPLFSRSSCDRVLSSQFYRFFTPVVQPHEIVKKIIATLDQQESKEILVPFYTNFVKLASLLPSFGRDFFQWLARADYAMEGYVKVTGRRPEEGPIPQESHKDD